MDWKLISKDGELLEFLFCQYDCLDFAVEEYDAITVQIDFKRKVATIIE